MSFIFLRNRVTGGAAFTPASLFASGEDGAWYEPSTTTTFLSTTDLTPCGYGNSCGLLLDKSQGAGYSGGSFTGLGSELVTNGTFDTDTSGWTATNCIATVSGGQVTLTNTSTSTGTLHRPITTVVGKTYFVTADYLGGTVTPSQASNLGNIAVGTIARDVDLVSASVVAVGESFAASFVATGTTSWVSLRCSNVVGETAIFDNVSVRELPGNHATQATAAARPILARVPSTGRRNLLERTEEFGTSPWTGTASVTANSDTAPDGTVTADTLTDAGGVVAKQQTVSLATSTNYAASVYLKKTTSASSFPMILVWSGIAQEASVIVNTDAGSAVARTGVTQAATGISVVSDGDFWRVSFTFSFSSTSGSSNFAVYPAANTDASSVYASGTTGSCVVWGAQLEAASSASAYQKVVDQYDITEAGVTSLEYLAFDGSDDGMATASIDFTATDKMSVFAGLEKETDPVSGGLLVELSASSTSNNGTFGLFTPSASSSEAFWRSKGTVSANGNTTGWSAAPSTFVATGLGDISGDISKLRENGTEKLNIATDQGTGNFGNYPIYIGARGGTVAFFDGKLFSLIVRGAASTAQEISDTESYVATKTGVSI